MYNEAYGTRTGVDSNGAGPVLDWQDPRKGDCTEADPLLRPSMHLYAQDGLFSHANSMIKKQKSKEVSLTVPILVLSATFVFSAFAAMLLDYFVYNSWPVWALAYAVVVSTIAELAVRFVHPGKRWKFWLGPMIIGGTVIGTLFGLVLYYRYWVLYLHYDQLEKFTNIAGSQPAAQFADAGMVQFSEDTQLDATRAVGYRSAETGHTLCVAPVVDVSMGTADTVSFFAVGVDCCDWRADFENCVESTGDKVARSGLMLLEPDVLAAPAMRWAVPETVDFASFDKAIKLEQAVFGTAVSENKRLVRWTNDPIGLQNNIWWAGFAEAIWYFVLIVLLSAFLASWMACGTQKFRETFVPRFRVGERVDS